MDSHSHVSEANDSGVAMQRRQLARDRATYAAQRVGFFTRRTGPTPRACRFVSLEQSTTLCGSAQLRRSARKTGSVSRSGLVWVVGVRNDRETLGGFGAFGVMEDAPVVEPCAFRWDERGDRLHDHPEPLATW